MENLYLNPPRVWNLYPSTAKNIPFWAEIRYPNGGSIGISNLTLDLKPQTALIKVVNCQKSLLVQPFWVVPRPSPPPKKKRGPCSTVTPSLAAFTSISFHKGMFRSLQNIGEGSVDPTAEKKQKEIWNHLENSWNGFLRGFEIRSKLRD